MSLEQPQSSEVDFSAYLDETVFEEDSSAPLAPSESTPTASASSGGSPTPFSPLPHPTESALTSASTSPPFSSAEFRKNAQSMDRLPDELEQIAASLRLAQHHQQYLASSSSTSSPALTLPMTIGSSQPSSLPPYLQAMQASSFPSQLPLDLINAANIAPSSSLPATPHPAYSGAMSPTAVPSFYGSMPSTPYPSGHPYGPMSANPALDPGLYALHASLEAQARLAAATSMSAPGTPSGFDLVQHEQQRQHSGSLSGSSTPAPISPYARNPARPAAKRTASTSYMKAAMGVPGSSSGHQRAQTQPPQAGSPLASPALLPNGFDTGHTYDFSPAATHQRPLPPLPKRQAHGQTTAPTHLSSADPTPPISRAHSPRYNLPPVDYDFSSLEQDLDRFTSSGGFASAAAAAMASVGPSSRRGHQGVDAYGVGGYGGSPTPKFAEALPSPRLVADVLGRESFFPPSNHPSPGGQVNSSSPSNSNQGLPSGVANVLSNEYGSNRPSPADSASPAGSTIIDEESAELLSQKDPIAAQVWRMFHKAKNTMPNGARMENLTWRLMSMTLRKRREESANSAGTGSGTGEAVNTPSPGTEDAKLRKAMEEAIEEAREEKEVVEEGRDVVQPLTGARGRNTQTRGRRDRVGASEDGERGRTRGTKTGTSSKSASPEVEAPEEMDWRALSKSRSRSRAPDMMDWRAQSRSRSRAPELRTSMAPPAIDATPATANFSRFFGDSGVPSSSASDKMPPPALPSSSSSSSTSTGHSRPTVEPLSMPTTLEDNSAALAELASSLGLSPQDQAQLFGSASARLDGHSLMDLPSPTNGLISPPTETSRLVSPGPLSPQTSTFAFPDSTRGVDPNLAAIESALNQLINLQSLASSPASTASPLSPEGAPLNQAKSPSATFAPSPLSNSTEPSGSRSRQTSGAGSLAQKQLQQFMTKGPTSPMSSSRRTSGSTSSAYGNAAALASSTRPFSFGSSSTSPSASGISLARPAQLPSEDSTPASPYADQPPFLFSASAPTQPEYLGSPNPSLFADGVDTANLLYDYFNPQHNSSSYPSFASGSEFGSIPVPTHVDPSQLLNTREAPYGSEGSSWGANAHSLLGSPHGISSESLASPPTTASANSGKSRLSVSSTGGRSSSTSNLATLSSSLPSSSSKTKSAPTSRAHSRSNTVSLPPPIHEGKPLEIDTKPNNGLVVDHDVKKEADQDDGVTRCLNCSTTNTPLWRRDAEGKPLCNACGLFRNLHGVDRPAGLNTGVIKRRNRNRGPKDPSSKKGTKTGPARRNSVNAAGTPVTPATSAAGRKERSSAPYPTAAQRAQQE